MDVNMEKAVGWGFHAANQYLVINKKPHNLQSFIRKTTTALKKNTFKNDTLELIIEFAVAAQVNVPPIMEIDDKTYKEYIYLYLIGVNNALSNFLSGK